MTLLRLVVLGSALLALTSACGRSDSASTDGGPRFPHPQFDPNTPGGDDDDDDNPAETPVETPAETPAGTPTPEPTATPVADEDGDGIPDVDDNLPCLAIKLTVSNDGVSSASLDMNGDEVVATSSFPTTQVVERYVNPVNGANDISVAGKLAGSPNDTLHLVVAAADMSATYLDETVTRNPGSPSQVSLSFVVNATCP